MRTLYKTLVILVMTCLPLQAQSNRSALPLPAQPQTLTLAQAEVLALKSNPQISIGKLRALIAQQFSRETRSILLPTASLNITAVDANPGSRLTAGALSNSTLFPRAAAGVTLSQLITDFGRTTNLLASSEFAAKAEDQNAVATAAQIRLAVDQDFYNALETQALLTVAKQTVDSRQLLVDKIQALTNAKLKSDLDLSFTRVDLARGRLLFLEAQNNHRAALAALSAILGFPDQQDFQLVDEQVTAAPPTPDVLPLIQQALQQRPEVAALQDQVEAAERFSKSEHELWRPTISALGVVGFTPVRDSHITPNWYGAVGVNINFPLFNGFLFNARAETSNLLTDINRQKLADLRNNIARDVRISWQDSVHAFERLSVTKQLKEEADLALELAQQRYNLGLSSIVEFSQAELGKTEADIADTDARYQYRMSQILLAYTTSTPR